MEDPCGIGYIFTNQGNDKMKVFEDHIIVCREDDATLPIIIETRSM